MIAYILSMLMLVLGSDALDNIKSVAAGIENAEEETEKSDIRQVLDNIDNSYKPYILNDQLVNPYSIKDYAMNDDTESPDDFYVQEEKNLWFLGAEMSHKQFDSLMMEAGELLDELSQKKASLTVSKQESKSSEQEEKTKDEVQYSVKVASYNKVISVTSEDVKMLERITEAEASGEDQIGKILIVNVILNRVASDKFPNTIKKVIFQNDGEGYQFSPVKSGKYWKVKISNETKKAVQKALEGEDYSKGALYFMARKHAKKKSAKWFDENLTFLFKHGEHEFFK